MALLGLIRTWTKLSTDCGCREPRAAYVDFLVELRGFEPLTSAVQAPARGDGAAASDG